MKPSPLSITLVVPTYNMAGFLRPLWNSLVESGLTDALQEVLFVDDGSTDDTSSVLHALEVEAEKGKLRIVKLGRNQGRFLARLAGSREAKADRVLFLDSRITLPKDFREHLLSVATQSRDIMGVVDIDTDRSVFCLYWDRSHRAIFRKHFKAIAAPFFLTQENFDEYLKGTGIFLCDRAAFIRACESFDSPTVLSDDTWLMRRMVEESPILVHPHLRIRWVPRETPSAFLGRLFERGPSFVEYHVFQRRGLFFWVVIAGILAGLSGLTLLVVHPPAALGLVAAVGTLFSLSLLVFTRNPLEWLRMLPLHLAVLFSFGTGILYGLWVNLSSERKARWLGHR